MKWSGVVLLCCLPVALLAQSIDPAQARELFVRAQQLSQKDGGRLWGKTLYGPMLLVEPQTRKVVANERDAEGRLQPAGDGIYTGSLPENVIIANTTTDWAGTRWTMLLWPVTGDRFSTDKLLAHELFHRIQKELGLMREGKQNPHLDSAEGRLWLQMEWRALAAALASQGKAQQQAISDACRFRAYRHGLFPGSRESERQLDVTEGVPEYTGLLTAAPDLASARWYEIAQLTSPDRNFTFVRSFPYTVGPAFGILLDERQPGWRKMMRSGTDPASLLCATVPPRTPSDALSRGALYGLAELRAEEREREQALAARKQHFRTLLVDGPTLTLPNMGSFNFGFNPRELISLSSDTTVYPTMQAQDLWGSLKVTDGAIMAADFGRVIIAAPASTDGSQLQGPGWTLQLAEGWKLAPTSNPGSYIVQRK